MAQFLPRFNPPPFMGRLGANLYSKVDDFLNYWGTYNQYLVNYMGRLEAILQALTGGTTAPFKSIASASTIRPLQEVQPITGTATIVRVEAPSDFTKLTLLSINGFTLASTDNIAVNKITMAGEQITLTKNLSDGKWYTLSRGAELTTHEATETAPIHGSTSLATANKLVHRNAAGRAKFVAGAAAGDALIFGQVAQTYSVTNVTTDRAYDADLTTLNELADVLGTLIADLRAAGVIQP